MRQRGMDLVACDAAPAEQRASTDGPVTKKQMIGYTDVPVAGVGQAQPGHLIRGNAVIAAGIGGASSSKQGDSPSFAICCDNFGAIDVEGTPQFRNPDTCISPLLQFKQWRSMRLIQYPKSCMHRILRTEIQDEVSRPSSRES